MMKKTVFAGLAFILLSWNLLWAQTYTGDLVLSTQAEVNSFSYSKVTGSLDIRGDDITDLTALSSLTSVGGNLNIQENPNLTHLGGLENLSTVGYNLHISDNPQLTNVNGLSDLSTVGTSFFILNNKELVDVDGLSNLSTIGKDFRIGHNPMLTNVDGLSNLSTVDGDIDIYFNEKLTNVDGLSNLSTVGNDLHISDNPQLTNVNGLSNLSTVGSSFFIWTNKELTNVDGLSNLSSVGDDFRIGYNSKLTHVDGLSNLSTVGTMQINDNLQLTNVDGLSALTTVKGILLLMNPNLTHVDGLSNLLALDMGLEISNNENLANLDGLSSLSTVGSLYIYKNKKLTHVDGLSNLSTVTNELGIGNNEKLTHVNGLSTLATVGKNLLIAHNSNLTNVDGLSALTTIGGKLGIENNPQLVNLNGLGALTSVNGAEPSLIQDNSLLNRFCGLYSWMSHQHPNINLVISGNANNPTPAEILADGPCPTTGIKGRVWFDADRSGTQEPDEPGLASATVQLLDTQGTILCKAATSPAGSYLLKNILPGDYVVQVDLSTLPVQDPELTAGQNPVAVTVPDDQSVFTIDFGFFGSDPNTVVRPQEPLPQDPDLEDNALVFVCGSPTYQSGKDCGWHNAVDGDVEGWDGTTLACGESDPADPAWAIFQFNTGGIFRFDILAFQTDNGTADDGQKYDYQTRKFEILVSTSGLADSDFTSLGKVTRRFDGKTMEFHKYDHMVQARYIMIRLHSPQLQGGWRQMVEFQPTTFDKRGAMAASHDRPVAALPESMSLNVYPNPFNPATTLSWSLPKDGHASVIVYDLSGAEVARLADGYHASGRYQVTWNAADRPSGVYFVRLYGAGMQKVVRMVLVK